MTRNYCNKPSNLLQSNNRSNILLLIYNMIAYILLISKCKLNSELHDDVHNCLIKPNQKQNLGYNKSVPAATL